MHVPRRHHNWRSFIDPLPSTYLLSPSDLIVRDFQVIDNVVVVTSIAVRIHPLLAKVNDVEDCGLNLSAVKF
jgi:hypothetical protein